MDAINETIRAAASGSFRSRVYVRDGDGNVTSIEDNLYPSSASTHMDDPTLPTPTSTARHMDFTYNGNGTMHTMTDPEGNLTTFTYQSGTGYLTKIEAPHGNGETGTRDTVITPNGDGTPAVVVDPKGQRREYTYDGLGRLTQIDYGVVSGVAAFSVSYTLDDDGNLTGMSDTAGVTVLAYDDDDQLASETRTPTGAAAKAVGYSYYANAQLQTITTYESESVTLTYDDLLRPLTQTDPKEGGGTIAFEHDDRSRLTKTTYPSGLTEVRAYGAKAGRLDAITLKHSSGTVLQSYAYDHAISQARSAPPGTTTASSPR